MKQPGPKRAIMDPLRRGGARKPPLPRLSSLSSASLSWLRKTLPADREPAGLDDEARTWSALAGLLSSPAVWPPWIRRRPRRGELKDTIVSLLTHVDYYEDRDTRRPMDPDAPGARSVGLPYREILRRVRAEHPGGSVSIMTIRSYARDARLEGHVMPYRRPYSRQSAGGSGPP